MKERVSMIDLIRMLRRFKIGKVSVSGDQGIYTSFDLDEIQWNLHDKPAFLDNYV